MAEEIEIRIPKAVHLSSERTPRVSWVTVAIMALYLGLAAVYIIITPLFEAPGELFAARYSTYLASTGRLPEYNSSVTWQQAMDAHQPPLYYAIGAMFMRGVHPDIYNTLVYNPYLMTSFEADTPGNKNALVHPLPALARDTLAPRIYLLRVLSLLFSLGFLRISWLVFRMLAPAQPGLQQAALAVTALNPLFIVASTAASGISLSCLWFALILYVYLALHYHKRTDWRWFLLLGLLVGAAALTSLAGLATVLILPAAVFLLRHPERPSLRRSAIILLAIALGAAVAVSGWWYIRNWVLYGQPVFLQTAVSLAGSRISFTGNRLGTSIAAYWGLFGWGSITAERAYYAIIGILGALGVLGLVLEIARELWEQGGRHLNMWRGWAGAAIWSGLFGLMTFLLPGLIHPPVMMLLALSPLLSLVIPTGLRAWFVVQRRDFLVWVMPVVLAIVAALAPWRYIEPAYSVSPPLTLADAPASLRNINLNYGTELFLLGYELPETHTRVGDQLQLRLYWLVKKKPAANYAVSIRIQGREQVQLGGQDSFPESGKRATASLNPGELLVEDYWIPIDKEALAPTAALIRLGMLDTDTGEYLPVSTPLGQPLESMPVIARSAIMPIDQDTTAPQTRLNLVLGNKIELLGYSLSSDFPEPGKQWQVTLYWRPVVPLSQDYTVFLHLYDDAGAKVAQIDEQPVNNYYPTSLWQTQEIIKDVHILRIPADLQTTSIELRLGMYLLETGERLAPGLPADGQTEVIIGPLYPQE